MEHVDVAVIGGGQSGLVAAQALTAEGLRPLVLEASDRAAGSWPRYYDSLTLFSPARFSAIPGTPFPGEGDHYPHRDEVTDYLTGLAAGLGTEIRFGTRVESVTASGDGGFLVRTEQGDVLRAAGVVAASGSFGNPHRPKLPGQDSFSGELLHVADNREPKPYAGKHVVVVGGGNSAVQVGYELAQIAEVTLATRTPIRFLPQTRNGKDIHHWTTTSGFDQLPPAWLARAVPGTLVMDTGEYRRALEEGLLKRREMFTALDGEHIVWPDGERERADVVLLATGYRPDLPYLHSLGALDESGMPLHSDGLSLAHPGLVHLGLEFQRSFASNTLRGVTRDAEHVIPPLVAHVRKAPATVGL
ncbi:flavin-containing monooxygenase [Streptomyces sp. CA-250714]|uniref:flavin-containing monooxygenase n=1 Tax=Streptomyces sp. CA-250714 TaxID=3240060 RepID=UPI003D94E4A7